MRNSDSFYYRKIQKFLSALKFRFDFSSLLGRFGGRTNVLGEF